MFCATARKKKFGMTNMSNVGVGGRPGRQKNCAAKAKSASRIFTSEFVMNNPNISYTAITSRYVTMKIDANMPGGGVHMVGNASHNVTQVMDVGNAVAGAALMVPFGLLFVTAMTSRVPGMAYLQRAAGGASGVAATLFLLVTIFAGMAANGNSTPINGTSPTTLPHEHGLRAAGFMDLGCWTVLTMLWSVTCEVTHHMFNTRPNCACDDEPPMWKRVAARGSTCLSAVYAVILMMFIYESSSLDSSSRTLYLQTDDVLWIMATVHAGAVLTFAAVKQSNYMGDSSSSTALVAFPATGAAAAFLATGLVATRLALIENDGTDFLALGALRAAAVWATSISAGTLMLLGSVMACRASPGTIVGLATACWAKGPLRALGTTIKAGIARAESQRARAARTMNHFSATAVSRVEEQL